MLFDFILILLGLVVLIAGAEGLVRGASSLAAGFKISALVIGLTVVALGTSSPELTVNVLAALGGSPDLAVGNVVGSNIANIFLILGITALIVPLTVKSSTVWKEVPLALMGIILIFIMGNDHFFDGTPLNALTRTDGIALLALMIIFMYYVFGLATSDQSDADAEIIASGEKVTVYSIPKSIGLTLLGLGGLILGGRMLVTGAVDVASTAGISEAMIGLTVVAIGTSLPELATSIVAALKKQADIAIGNVVGSNIFNVFFVLGTTSTITPLTFSGAINFDIGVAIFATLLLFLFMFVGGKHRLIRWEGGVFVALYIAYMVFVVFRG
jgi:cation:H+ antiporter